ncbi:hypothetical protein GGR56DRAFT_199496 [Xylariaceae sp. FL0804]|nr:hypothetical protein GGR56DRAFT_199496 [Xylariaceae sp. FL0804]
MFSLGCYPSKESESAPRTREIAFIRASALSEVAELVPAVACSIVATAHVCQGTSAASSFNTGSAHRILAALRPSFLSPPSPGLVLGSCLVLGCCLSSYMHRRRAADPYQAAVFAAWAAWAVCIGWSAGSSADAIVLAIVPWALTAAMPSCFLAHAGGRWLAARRKREVETVVAGAADEEKK